jgi:hypothetical protein
MELIIFAAFFGLLTLLSAIGWVADSRDGVDWTPTVNGVRAPARRPMLPAGDAVHTQISR